MLGLFFCVVAQVLRDFKTSTMVKGIKPVGVNMGTVLFQLFVSLFCCFCKLQFSSGGEAEGNTKCELIGGGDS